MQGGSGVEKGVNTLSSCLLAPSFLPLLSSRYPLGSAPTWSQIWAKGARHSRARPGTHSAGDGDGEEERNNDVRRAGGVHVYVCVCRSGLPCILLVQVLACLLTVWTVLIVLL